MRPSKYCPKFLPWVGTNRGEIDDVCIDEIKRTIKKCNDCIGHPERKEEEKNTVSTKAYDVSSKKASALIDDINNPEMMF